MLSLRSLDKFLTGEIFVFIFLVRARSRSEIPSMVYKVIPDDVEQFILDKIDSVAQMEALLFLRSQEAEEWTIEALSKRLYISEEETTESLEHLRAGGFLIASTSEPFRYRYAPISVELRQTVDRAADIYRKHLIPVTNLIHSKPKTRIREFADAFKLRKDE